MPRIISDSFYKKDKHIWGNNPNESFNQRILAVNNMYDWLYEEGILRKVSFVFKDYEDATYFALDAKELEPYRSQMEASTAEGAALAVRHIFDEEYTPCVYSGAIELGWTMASYRDVDGCIGRSWECGLIKGLNTESIYAVSKVRDEEGVKAAVIHAFSRYDWDPTIDDRLKAAMEYFQIVNNKGFPDDFVHACADKLIYCYENKKDLIDFDFWLQYEALCEEPLTYDEYLAIDANFDGDPYDVSLDDSETVSRFKQDLAAYRQAQAAEKEAAVKKPSLGERIAGALSSLVERNGKAASKETHKDKVPDDQRW